MSAPQRLRSKHWLPLWKKAGGIFREIFAGGLVIVEAADVLPIAIGLETKNAVVLFLHGGHELRHVVAAFGGNHFERAARKHIDAHADGVMNGGLLAIFAEAIGFVGDDDAVIDEDIPAIDRDGRERFL